MMETDIKLRLDILKAGKFLVSSRLVQGTGGNISVRTERGFIITPSGMEYAMLTPDDLVEMDLDGRILNGVRKPSIEKDMHRLILRARPDVSAVVHTHATFAVAVASSRRSLPAMTDNQIAEFGGTVPTADYAPIGTPELARNVTEALGSGKGVLMANHGMVCVGKTIGECLSLSLELEESAKIYILSKIVGGVPIDDETAHTESDDLKKRYGQV